MSFPQPYVIDAKFAHTHTAVLLHGRSSNGPDFAEELLDIKTSQNESLLEHFPGFRWVFPTSCERWSSIFQEPLTQWFDIASLSNPCESQESQVSGLRESALYILDILRKEIDLLDGRAENIVLGGMSQGMALGLWAMLCSPGQIKGSIGAFIGMCGWLPFINRIQTLGHQEQTASKSPLLPLPKLLLDIMKLEETQCDTVLTESILMIPVLLLHGTDDIWVASELGKDACRTLKQIGIHVNWKEYTEAENDGHWIKEPDSVDDIVRFLEENLGLAN